MFKRAIFFSAMMIFAFQVFGQQQSLCKKFKKLQRPEKWWAITHPFIAKKAWRATQRAKEASDIHIKNPKLDGQRSGGQVDAFRHAYWMALLVRDMKQKKALKLGKAHEKSNFIDFKKNRREDGFLPDKASKEMDLFNNMKGAEIGIKYLNISQDSLEKIILDNILKGNMKIVYRDSLHNFLNCQGEIIPLDSLKGRWDNGKCLIKSNYFKE